MSCGRRPSRNGSRAGCRLHRRLHVSLVASIVHTSRLLIFYQVAIGGSQCLPTLLSTLTPTPVCAFTFYLTALFSPPSAETADTSPVTTRNNENNTPKCRLPSAFRRAIWPGSVSSHDGTTPSPEHLDAHSARASAPGLRIGRPRERDPSPGLGWGMSKAADFSSTLRAAADPWGLYLPRDNGYQGLVKVPTETYPTLDRVCIRSAA